MIDRPRTLRRLSLLLLAVPVLWAGPARAADKDDFKLRYAATSDPATAKNTLLVRPNQTRDYFVFVEGFAQKDEAVTVDVLVGDKLLEGGSVTVMAKARGLTPVPLGKPPVPPAPGDKPAVPAAPPAVPEKAAPPALLELKGELKLVLHGKDAAGQRIDLDQAFALAAAPSAYVTVTGYYDPKATTGVNNQLVFKVVANPETFQGGKCRVDIALDPKRVPGLVETPKKDGTRGGYLEDAGDELTLTANNLQFRDAGTTTDEENAGTVYVTIDGYERAYIFKSTFPRSGVTESQLDRVRIPVARLLAPVSWDPAKPLPVALEVDNAPAASVVEIGFNRSGTTKNRYTQKAGEVTTLGSGSRRQQFFVNPAFPAGALQIKTLVSDWNTNLDVAEIYGPRLLRLRLLKDEKEIGVPKDEDKKVVEFSNGATNVKGTDITQTVVFDGTPPENLKFVDFPAKLVRGSVLPVRATVTDPESGVKEVFFYVGKPGPDGKMPATAQKVVGRLTDPKTGEWTAALDAPTDQKGKVDVTAQATNGAGLVAEKSVVVQLVDALPGAAGAAGGATAGKASIEGKVFQGDRPQPNVAVFLRDAAGGVKDTTTTDDKGGYLFKELAPATYRVFANKTGDNTKGETVVQVQEGQKKTDVAVTIVR